MTITGNNHKELKIRKSFSLSPRNYIWLEESAEGNSRSISAFLDLLISETREQDAAKSNA